MNHDLVNKKCVACEGGTRPLDPATASQYMEELPGWQLSVDARKISRTFEFENFVKAMVFVNSVADLAESEGHHPDITIRYNKVILDLWTHAIKGLSENDFILAAKVNIITIY
jgi:4a-hydroxytetrahydrobiopterin dehydratase